MENLSKGAAQAGIAIDIARRLETALEGLGATGKGLHEKTTSVEGKLPEALVTRLRFVASVRNKIVHEDDLLPDDDMTAFAEAGNRAIDDLAGMVAKGKSGDTRPKGKPRRKKASQSSPATPDGSLPLTGDAIRLGGALALAGVAFVFLLMVLGSDGTGLWVGAFSTYVLLGWYFLRRMRQPSRRPSGAAR